MRIIDIIEKKRDGLTLTTEEIQFFVTNYTNGTIPDYQMSALLMVIFFQGMNEIECAELTKAMMNSGDTVDLSSIAGIKVDKHSTGGVGDTTTLVLAPLVAALDIPVAKMSGRGLGHTGGTTDKFEAILGFKIEISNEQFIKQVNDEHIAIIGQSGNLTPADKKMYALRDVTGSVNSIPLIASSIMSKKLAAGADAIVLDVKIGDGAFMKTEKDALILAKTMVNIGNNLNRSTMAIISDMSQPLGFAIGNALEIKEAIATLKGEGPEDLTELSLTLASQMVVLAKKTKNLEEAKEKLQEVIKNGKAIAKLKALIKAQGGDESIVDHPEKLAQAPYQITLPSKESGYVSKILADKVGVVAMQLGAGRATKDDVIDPAVGIVLHKKVGDKITEGESLLTIHANSDQLEVIKNKLYECIEISEHADKPALIHQIVTA